MKDEFKYKGVEMTDFNLIDNLCLFMSSEAYDVYLHCDDNFWLGSNGRIYEFEYIPCEEQYIREYANWDDFNELYPK